jgi:hypothetical protein
MLNRKNVASQLLYSGDVFDDVQICVNVKLLESVAADKEYASLVFWAKDYSSYCFSMVRPMGSGWRNTYGRQSVALSILCRRRNT